jgi:hypothetical protein
MKVKIKWKKDGDYLFIGCAVMHTTGEFLLLYRGETGGVLAAPFELTDKFRKGMPRNRRFNLMHEQAEEQANVKA